VTCDDDAQIVFLIILAVYKGFLLFVGSVLAILTRKMPSAFSEAKLVGFAVSLLFFELLLQQYLLDYY